jgi:ribosome-binding ATPase
MEIGIVGLPNVGKSTLFNALLKRQVAYVANFPFATIEPNIGVVPVPDDRLEKLAKVVSTIKIVNATVKFVDIAGLVKGASQGEGLGNKFLSHIREVDAIAFVLRDFSDENIIRSGSTDPQSDYEVLKAELILADLDTVTKILDGKDKSRYVVAEKLKAAFEAGISAHDVPLDEKEAEAVKQMSLLSSKPEIKVYNSDENKLGGESDGVRICARMEAELAELSDADQKAYLADLGITESGLVRLIKKAFDLLGLQTFLTAGEIEARAWTIKKGTKAPAAAGVIHTDFEKNFIKADVVDWEEFVSLGGWVKAREAGKVRMEGREYIMKEGDVVEFKVGV